MLPQKFKELEDKIRLTAELVSQLKFEKLQLERKHLEAEQRIAELEVELQRIKAERDAITPSMDNLLQQLDTLQTDYQDTTAHRLKESLVKDPANVKTLFEIGSIYERQGLYEKAILEYRKVLKINPDFVDAIEHLAFLLEKLNRDNEASPLWERILSLKKRG
ncbi:MAG: cell division protein ZapB [Nitrospinae bacterium]|nr:cell division protein ZapB [Nitrospinota bacterium]